MEIGNILRPRIAKTLTAIAVVSAAILIVVECNKLPVFDEAWIHQTICDLGAFGPFALIGLMVLAIVVSPIPSGPIAVAAGALYGGLEGAMLSMVGHFLPLARRATLVTMR
jgi:uncharacterized membrane protein YdjX (TVP38/TMEM64 family)